MEKDLSQVCWYCSSRDLEPDEYGVRCRKCGATWNSLPGEHRTSVPGFVIGAPRIFEPAIGLKHPRKY